MALTYHQSGQDIWWMTPKLPLRETLVSNILANNTPVKDESLLSTQWLFQHRQTKMSYFWSVFFSVHSHVLLTRNWKYVVKLQREKSLFMCSPEEPPLSDEVSHTCCGDEAPPVRKTLRHLVEECLIPSISSAKQLVISVMQLRSHPTHASGQAGVPDQLPLRAVCSTFDFHRFKCCIEVTCSYLP